MGRIRLSRITEIMFGRTAKMSIAATTVVVAAGLLLPSPAYAAGTQWAVTAYNGSTPIAKANGDFANNGGVYATAGINYVDMSNNGHSVYVQVDWWYFRSPAPGLPKGWVKEDNKQTPHTERMKYTATELSRRLQPEAQQVKAQIKVCEDVPHRGDICSAPANVSFSY
jgi:hypothetical protein